MELEFLGTGAGVPSKGRNVSSIALKMLDERNEVWLFDVGEATQHQILKTAIKPRKITKIFISHLHGDHIFGLPGLLSSRANQGGNSPLEIYGPVGIKEYVETSLKVTGGKLGYRIKYIELKNDGEIFNDKTFSVSAGKLKHRITCFGYRVVEKPRTGELLVDKLEQYNIPNGPIFGQLKAGKTVTLDDGTVLNGKDFIGPDKPSKVVTVISDTRYTPKIDELAQDADVLVHESTFSNDEKQLAYNYYHSTATQAAEVAKRRNVKGLILTHISARYTGRGAFILQKEAQKIFKHTKVANDFDIYEVPFK
ncbi:ribonuclease Z [Companilactobacillus crustorum]|uniref:Ribonuclease Z n=3 Tax=Companilactobacillus TaxID=2767879 RepID=A0A837RGW8_9LACO|nr:ribonuclease Z [Companilactobacillus crustorum]HCD07235.1 ribonuclease Z [Lactobacillus sp.]APU71482.1 Ribonuclease Z [Companilactobacillus crustorum]KRK41421.1 beta-lactamase superfamily hydrolase [Companilactobacillus crustorum JCM 15951]KRO19019.1 beta-lactamase superfamily hydrolase [Companilactobacillus crustorum]WDT66492.1 ribonuclease Z [Companilactobacillus crustorum]